MNLASSTTITKLFELVRRSKTRKYGAVIEQATYWISLSSI